MTMNVVKRAYSVANADLDASFSLQVNIMTVIMIGATLLAILA